MCPEFLHVKMSPVDFFIILAETIGVLTDPIVSLLENIVKGIFKTLFPLKLRTSRVEPSLCLARANSKFNSKITILQTTENN